MCIKFSKFTMVMLYISWWESFKWSFSLFSDQRPMSANQRPQQGQGQGDPRNPMYRGQAKKPEVGQGQGYMWKLAIDIKIKGNL